MSIAQVAKLDQDLKMSKHVCKCGKGYASTIDWLCRFCREDQHCPTQRDCRRYGIRRGEGLTVYQFLKIKEAQR